MSGLSESDYAAARASDKANALQDPLVPRRPEHLRWLNNFKRGVERHLRKKQPALAIDLLDTIALGIAVGFDVLFILYRAEALFMQGENNQTAGLTKQNRPRRVSLSGSYRLVCCQADVV